MPISSKTLKRRVAGKAPSQAKSSFPTPTDGAGSTIALDSEGVNVVNVGTEVWHAGTRRFSEPIIRQTSEGWTLEYVGHHDEDESRAQLFTEFGTPGYFLKGGMILLPTEESDYGTAEALHKATIDFINRYCQLPKGIDVVAAYYVRLTWLYDAFSELPYMRFRGTAFGVGKSRALEVVGSLCRRATLVSGASSPAAIRRILDASQGTLLIDEGDLDSKSTNGKALMTMLLTGFQRGRMVCLSEPSKNGSWTPTSFEAFGPKIVAHHHRFTNAALESRFIDCFMEPKTRKLPVNLPQPEFDQEALLLRNQYLAYRRDLIDKVQIDPSLERHELEDRTNQIAIPLLSLVADEGDRQVIVDALIASQNQVRADIAASTDGILAEELLERSAGASRVPLSVIAGSVGCALGMTERAIGARYRMMGLNLKRLNTGSVVITDDKCRQYLRTILRREPSSAPSPCSLRSLPYKAPNIERKALDTAKRSRDN